MQVGVGRSAGLGGDLAAGAAGVVGEHREPQLAGQVDLLAVDGRPTHRHPLLDLRYRHPHRRKMRLLERGALLGWQERQQRRHRLGRAEVAVDPRHVKPAVRDPLARGRVEPGHVGGLDQPLAGDRMQPGGQPLERFPVQSLQAESGPELAVQLCSRFRGRAVGAEVVVGLLAAALKVAPQVAADPGDRRSLELPRYEHRHPAGPTRSDRTSQPPAAHREPHSAPAQRGPTDLDDRRAGRPHRTPQEADTPRCPAAPGQLSGGERPRLRRRGRAPAPGRGPAVVAAVRPDPTALGGRVRALRGPSDRPAAALDPTAAAAGRPYTPPRAGGARPPGRGQTPIPQQYSAEIAREEPRPHRSGGLPRRRRPQRVIGGGWVLPSPTGPHAARAVPR